jgi:hypothetical protein
MCNTISFSFKVLNTIRSRYLCWTDSLFNMYIQYILQDIEKGGITSVRYLEVALDLIWSLEFLDFAEDFVRYNLDDNQAPLLLCKLEGDQLLCRFKW